jgi:hypothetical protein
MTQVLKEVEAKCLRELRDLDLLENNLSRVANPHFTARIFTAFVCIARRYQMYYYFSSTTDRPDDHWWVVNWVMVERIQKQIDKDSKEERYGFRVWQNTLKNELTTWNRLQKHWNEHSNNQQVQLDNFYQETDAKMLTFEETIDKIPPNIQYPQEKTNHWKPLIANEEAENSIIDLQFEMKINLITDDQEDDNKIITQGKPKKKKRKRKHHPRGCFLTSIIKDYSKNLSKILLKSQTYKLHLQKIYRTQAKEKKFPLYSLIMRDFKKK